jgi:amidase
MTDALAGLDAIGQAELVRSGEVSPAELVDAAIERIEALDPLVEAILHPTFDRARERARSSELPDGPFRGVPIVLKDALLESEGDPYTGGMRFLAEAGYVSPVDSTFAARLKAAGFVVVAKSDAAQMAMFLTSTDAESWGMSRNPWNPELSTLGSSSGSAAAVASGMVPVGHGNDSGGSIRIPASACGLVGLKPSRGRNPQGPLVNELVAGIAAMNVENVLTRSVRDTAALLDVTSGPMPGDTLVAPLPRRPFVDEVGAEPGRLRIGLQREPFMQGVVEPHPDCLAAVEDAAVLLGELGHDVVPVDAPSHEFALNEPLYEPQASPAFVAVARFLDAWSRKLGRELGVEDVGPQLLLAAELGRSASAPAVLEMHDLLLNEIPRRMGAWWDELRLDLLLTPTLAILPPPYAEFMPPPQGTFELTPDNPFVGLEQNARIVLYTVVFNFTGQPAISLPLFWNEAGLPIGTQLAARYGREDVLLRVASQLEQARPWADRQPPVFAGSVVTRSARGG